VALGGSLESRATCPGCAWLGTALGWIGVTALFAGTLLGLVLGGVSGLIAVMAGWRRWREQFTFGPFLVLGTLVALLLAR
jgi:leader peptidase (prepilin peptidase)/N-methyltransferase